METIKGLLAFISCPIFGRLSDHVGRKYCLLVTVIGSTLPVCLMALTPNIYLFVGTMAVSGIFSATFPLTFAYISDCVDKNKRAPAYGLALATFGLSFCIGPIAGSYLASQFGNWAVFVTSLVLVVLDVVYIVAFLPESVQAAKGRGLTAMAAFEQLPAAWNVQDTFKVFNRDPFMRRLAVVVFLYYTAVWALVSTLVVFVTRHLGLTAAQLGGLLSAYGLATVVSEAVLLRMLLPMLGELRCLRLGLVAFAAQCALAACAKARAALAASVLLSMLANLVYPAASSLVSRVVEEEGQGEALGALNGIKAITEGFGPLVFGSLMALFEFSPIPGAPYLLGTFCALFALLESYELPTLNYDDDFGPHRLPLLSPLDRRTLAVAERAGATGVDGDGI